MDDLGFNIHPTTKVIQKQDLGLNSDPKTEEAQD